MGSRGRTSAQARNAEKTRRASPPGFADDHLEGRQSPGSSSVNAVEIAADVRESLKLRSSLKSCNYFTHHNPLVSWNWAWGWYNSGRVRDLVNPLVLIEDQDRSVSLIRALPLAVKETRTVTGATKPAAQGQCRLGQLALQAGVI